MKIAWAHHKYVFYFLGVLTFLGATNTWLGWEGAKQYLYLSDVANGYEVIARAAPALPSSILVTHHGQRFLLPYVVGLFSYGSGWPIYVWFSVVTFLLVAASLLVFSRILGAKGLGAENQFLAISFWALSPYSFRYYFIATGMASDLLFIFGLLILLLGIVKKSNWLLLVGAIVGVLGKQTMFCALPGILWLIWVQEDWERTRKINTVACLLGSFATTFLLVWLGSRNFSAGGPGIAIFWELGHWIFSDQASFRALAELITRILLPLLPISAAILALWDKKYFRELCPYFVMALGIAAQPFLAGPELTGQNAGRLAALGLAPLVIAFSLELKSYSGKGSLLLVALLAAGSLHHLYTAVGPQTAIQFMVGQIIISAVIFIFLRLNFRNLRL